MGSVEVKWKYRKRGNDRKGAETMGRWVRKRGSGEGGNSKDGETQQQRDKGEG